MILTRGSVTALTPVPADTWALEVTVSDEGLGQNGAVYPLLAWATVVVDQELVPPTPMTPEGRMQQETGVYPLVLVDGYPRTSLQLLEDLYRRWPGRHVGTRVVRATTDPSNEEEAHAQ